MSRLNRKVYDLTKSADLSGTRADPIGLCQRPGRRLGSPTKSGRARLVEFGLYLLSCALKLNDDDDDDDDDDDGKATDKLT